VHQICNESEASIGAFQRNGDKNKRDNNFYLSGLASLSNIKHNSSCNDDSREQKFDKPLSQSCLLGCRKFANAVLFQVIFGQVKRGED
jgi:hypothetical protein